MLLNVFKHIWIYYDCIFSDVMSTCQLSTCVVILRLVSTSKKHDKMWWTVVGFLMRLMYRTPTSVWHLHLSELSKSAMMILSLFIFCLVSPWFTVIFLCITFVLNNTVNAANVSRFTIRSRWTTDELYVDTLGLLELHNTHQTYWKCMIACWVSAGTSLLLYLCATFDLHNTQIGYSYTALDDYMKVWIFIPNFQCCWLKYLSGWRWRGIQNSLSISSIIIITFEASSL